MQGRVDDNFRDEAWWDVGGIIRTVVSARPGRLYLRLDPNPILNIPPNEVLDLVGGVGNIAKASMRERLRWLPNDAGLATGGATLQG